jgi:hypothetical protein
MAVAEPDRQDYREPERPNFVCVRYAGILGHSVAEPLSSGVCGDERRELACRKQQQP